MRQSSTALILFAIIILSCKQHVEALFPSQYLRHPVASVTDWSDIQPREQLVYEDCYGDIAKNNATFKCARLLVPLDWRNTSNQNRIALAIIKLEARADSLHGENKDASESEVVFWNPGGPGSSGVDAVLNYGTVMQDQLDGNKSFAILSWDPRGVGKSGHVNCFDSAFQSDFWSYQQRCSGYIDRSGTAASLKLAGFQGRANKCAMQRYNNTEDRLHTYMTTASTARDMLEILKLEKERPPIHDSAFGARLSTMNGQTSLGSNTKDIRLNYLGSSYGTFLGNTFASLYPQHVGNMLLDGNIDADNWVSKWWTTCILDFEAIWQVFYDRCYIARSSCALWRSSDVCSQDIEVRTQKALESIKIMPIPISINHLPELFTYSDLQTLVFESFYSVTRFPALAAVLNAVYTRNASNAILSPKTTISCSKNDSLFYDRVDAFTATFCGDADPILLDTSMSEFQSYLIRLQAQSPTVGSHSAEGRLGCMGQLRELSPRGRFAGPFGADSGNFQTPILFLNNRLDPVCPIVNAHKMAAKYPGSIVLEQDAVGHCALSASLGSCVKYHVKKYFNEGILPPKNTVCPGGCQAFDNNCTQNRMHDIFV